MHFSLLTFFNYLIYQIHVTLFELCGYYYLSNSLDSTYEADVHQAPSRCKTQHQPPLQGPTGLNARRDIQRFTVPKVVHWWAHLTLTDIACIKDNIQRDWLMIYVTSYFLLINIVLKTQLPVWFKFNGQPLQGSGLWKEWKKYQRIQATIML